MNVGRELLEFPDGRAWERWLAKHHNDQFEAWLRIGKKNADTGLITIGAALDGALCFGWIDAIRQGHDDVSFVQRYCRRTARSSWSQVNVGKAEQLIDDSRMQPAGYAEIEAAQADGRWQAAYVSQREAEPPADLVAALARNPVAYAAFDALSRSERYAAFLSVIKARTDATRTRAISRVVENLGKGRA